ncbi:MAG: hypothetical protein ABI837_07540, partial [Acidobacteriota bacterium]
FDQIVCCREGGCPGCCISRGIGSKSEMCHRFVGELTGSSLSTDYLSVQNLQQLDAANWAAKRCFPTIEIMVVSA